MILASFAEMVSRSDDSSRYGHSDRPSGLLFPHFHARQATLHTAFAAQRPGSTAMQVHIRYRTTVGYHEGSSPLHNIQSPQRPGHLLHAIGDSPSAAGAIAFPQHPPQTGRKKQTPRGSQVCQTKDF